MAAVAQRFARGPDGRSRLTSNYPESIAAIASWARSQEVPVSEARQRYAQFAVLHAIASSRTLRAALCFKGGNALDFVWFANRSTLDLDFSIADEATESQLVEALREGLAVATAELGLTFRIQKVERRPPSPDFPWATVRLKVGYAFPDEPRLRGAIARGEDLSAVVPVEISLNEVVGASELVQFGGSEPLAVCTLEDIVAEKLRALLQQALRNRTRNQDLLDIAAILRDGPALDLAKVADFLQRKAAARNVPVSRSAFRDPELAARAHREYATLQETTRRVFIPFDEALAALEAFVEQLPIDP